MEYSPKNIERAKLLGSLFLFTRVFYEIRTGREFRVVIPTSRESHIITICRELTKCFRLQTNRLIVNLPPGLFKSTLLKYFVAWSFAHYADCQFLYISYSHHLAAEHTADIKGIMSLKEYRDMFNVEISKDSAAKDNFKTTAGGAVKAFGSGGAIVGQDAGLPIMDRFSGCPIIDDPHKPDEVHSEPLRNSVLRNYNETIKQRPRSPAVPIIGVGQRLHEADLWSTLLSGNDGYEWKSIILKGRDEAGNSIHPEIYPLVKLEIEEKFNRYVFASQIQQNPMPAGGALFNGDWFIKLDNEPNILLTFIVIDTAETDKNYNDATAMSFWGIYKLEELGHTLDEYALHWIDCWEEWVEPKDLQKMFLDFYTSCMRHKVKPRICAIEKKSTGTSLLSSLSDFRGMNILDIKRTEIGKSKSQRFLDVQPYIASKLISLPITGKHTPKCIEHMKKITANETHRYDDIADTCADAIKMALIDRSISALLPDKDNESFIQQLTMQNQNYREARQNIWHR